MQKKKRVFATKSLPPEHNARVTEGEEGDQDFGPESIPESKSPWYVTEATKNVQERVRRMVRRAGQILTEKQFRVFTLIAIDELSYRDAAKKLAIPGKAEGVHWTTVAETWKTVQKKLQAEYKRIERTDQ